MYTTYLITITLKAPNRRWMSSSCKLLQLLIASPSVWSCCRSPWAARTRQSCPSSSSVEPSMTGTILVRPSSATAPTARSTTCTSWEPLGFKRDCWSTSNTSCTSWRAAQGVASWETRNSWSCFWNWSRPTTSRDQVFRRLSRANSLWRTPPPWLTEWKAARLSKELSVSQECLSTRDYYG